MLDRPPRHRYPLWIGLVASMVLASGDLRAAGFETIPERSRLIRHYRQDHAHAGEVIRSGSESQMRYPSQQQYHELRDASLELVSQFLTSNRDVVIGLGRSTGAVTAMMRNLGLRALSFPDGGWSGTGGAAPQQSTWPSYQAHFDKILGKEVLHGEHRIIVVDRVCSGSSLAKVKGVLEPYLAQVGSRARVVTVGFGEGQAPHADHTIELRDGNHLLEFNGKDFDGALGRFAYHQASNYDVSRVKLNPAHDQLSRAVLDALKADSALDGWIISEAPAFLWEPPATRAAADADVTSGAAGDGPLFSLTDPRGKYGLQGYMSRAQYGQIRDVATDLLRSYPASKCHLVFVGQNVAPLHAFFEKAAAGLSSFLPADGLGKRIKREWEPIFDAHFQHFLPGPQQLGNRQLVLVRQGTTGKSLGNLRDQLARYLQQAGLNNPVDAVALTESLTSGNTVGVRLIDVSNHPELVAFRHGAQKAVAPYASHRIGRHDLNELKAQQGYRDLLDGMKQRIAEDAPLHSALRELLAW